MTQAPQQGSSQGGYVCVCVCAVCVRQRALLGGLAWLQYVLLHAALWCAALCHAVRGAQWALPPCAALASQLQLEGGSSQCMCASAGTEAWSHCGVVAYDRGSAAMRMLMGSCGHRCQLFA